MNKKSSKMKQHLVKKAAIVAITLTSIGVAGGAAQASEAPVSVKQITTTCSPDHEACDPLPVMMSRSGIRW